MEGKSLWKENPCGREIPVGGKSLWEGDPSPDKSFHHPQGQLATC